MTVQSLTTRGAMDKARRTAESLQRLLDWNWDGLPDENNLRQFERMGKRLQSEIAAIRSARALPDMDVGEAGVLLAAGAEEYSDE